MRFTRFPRWSYEVTTRKVAAHSVKQRRERERLSLFADEVATAQASEPSAADVVQQRAQALARGWADLRSSNALWWLQARAALRALPEPHQSAVLDRWQHHRWLPGSANYLAGLVREKASELGIPYESLIPGRLRR